MIMRVSIREITEPKDTHIGIAYAIDTANLRAIKLNIRRYIHYGKPPIPAIRFIIPFYYIPFVNLPAVLVFQPRVLADGGGINLII